MPIGCAGSSPALRTAFHVNVGRVNDCMCGGWGRLMRVTLLHATLLCAAPALAQDAAIANEHELRQKAKQHFEQGVADYESARYEQALANFQEAHRLRPHPLVHVNIANCYDQLRKPLQSIFHFERFLESEAGTPGQRHEVTTALERLRAQVGRLLLRISPDGATVTIDHGEQRRAPLLEPIQLEAGEHQLQVRLEGYKTLERAVRVRGDSTYELNVTLERAGEGDGAGVLSITKIEDPEPAAASTAPVAAEATASAEPVHARDTHRVTDSQALGGFPDGVWVAGGVAAGLAATTLVVGVLALSADAEFEDQRARLALAATPNERVALYADASDAADRAQTLAVTTDILLAMTAAGAALTTYLALTHDGGPDTAGASLTPVLARDGAGMHLRAAF